MNTTQTTPAALALLVRTPRAMFTRMHLWTILVAFFMTACAACSSTGGTYAEPPAGAIDPMYPAVGAPVVNEAPLAPVLVYIDPSVTKRTDVIAAVQSWGRAFEGVREWGITDSTSDALVHVVEVGKYARVCPAETDSGCALRNGLRDARPGDAIELYLYTGNYERAAKWVVIHELGHLLGLSHDDGTVMAPKWTIEAADQSWACPDQESLARVEWLWGVDLAECGT